MNPRLMEFIDLFLPLLHLLVMSWCIKAFLGSPRRWLPAYIGWIFYYIYQVLAICMGFIPPFFLLVGNILLVFCISSCSSHYSRKHRFLFSVLICTIWMLVEIMVALLLESLGISGHGLRIAGSIISEICMLALAIITKRCIKKERIHQDIPLKYFTILLLIPASSIYLIHHIFLIAANHREHSSFAFSASVILLLVSYVVFEVYEGLAKESGTREKNHLYEQQLELCSRQAEERERLYLEVRRIRHDMKHHLSALSGMVKKGNREEAADYIQELLDDGITGSPAEVSRSGNIVVDSLVNHKYSLAHEEGIRFEANVFLPSLLPFRSGHLAIILGNLLDNALEACRNYEGERYIRLDVSYQKGVLFLTMANPYQGEVKRSNNGKLLTKKEDYEWHGIGLSSVEKAVTDYKGALKTENDNGTFRVSLVMYGMK